MASPYAQWAAALHLFHEATRQTKHAMGNLEIAPANVDAQGIEIRVVGGGQKGRLLLSKHEALFVAQSIHDIYREE